MRDADDADTRRLAQIFTLLISVILTISGISVLFTEQGIEELQKFPNISQIRRLANHPLADYRLRVGNYRILFDVNWEKEEIYILKIGHRKNVY